MEGFCSHQPHNLHTHKTSNTVQAQITICTLVSFKGRIYRYLIQLVELAADSIPNSICAWARSADAPLDPRLGMRALHMLGAIAVLVSTQMAMLVYTKRATSAARLPLLLCFAQFLTSALMSGAIAALARGRPGLPWAPRPL